jgi:hypothetical protein
LRQSIITTNKILNGIKQRNIQRIFGTTIGLVISAFLLNLALTTFESIVMITILFVTVEYFIRRNYGVIMTIDSKVVKAKLSRKAEITNPIVVPKIR